MTRQDRLLAWTDAARAKRERAFAEVMRDLENLVAAIHARHPGVPIRPLETIAWRIQAATEGAERAEAIDRLATYALDAVTLYSDPTVARSLIRAAQSLVAENGRAV